MGLQQIWRPLIQAVYIQDDTNEIIGQISILTLVWSTHMLWHISLLLSNDIGFLFKGMSGGKNHNKIMRKRFPRLICTIRFSVSTPHLSKRANCGLHKACRLLPECLCDRELPNRITLFRCSDFLRTFHLPVKMGSRQFCWIRVISLQPAAFLTRTYASSTRPLPSLRQILRIPTATFRRDGGGGVLGFSGIFPTQKICKCLQVWRRCIYKTANSKSEIASF